MRGATSTLRACLRISSNFNPRSSCEERPGCHAFLEGFMEFQSTLLMRGATLRRRSGTNGLSKFQSTLLMRGATWTILDNYLITNVFQSTLLMRGATCFQYSIVYLLRLISIHAPHARSDSRSTRVISRADCDFNPRSSCEERLTRAGSTRQITTFQSTLLMRGATKATPRWQTMPSLFQSTLLMRGATALPCQSCRR